MKALPPGTILQLMYLKERLALRKPGRFVEIGAGAGDISALLLSLGWTGEAYDLEATTVDALISLFPEEMPSGKFTVTNEDWLSSDVSSEYDLVISCKVMEHLDDAGESEFILKSWSSLKSGGIIITIVPGSPKHWGVEDEVAGHYRRYTDESARQIFVKNKLGVTHAAGLTFPVSNFLFPISNFIVARNESQKLSMDMIERTKKSGIREVPMKTKFPSFFGLLLNDKVMYPLHILQKLFKGSRRALVIYCETNPK